MYMSRSISRSVQHNIFDSSTTSPTFSTTSPSPQEAPEIPILGRKWIYLLEPNNNPETPDITEDEQEGAINNSEDVHEYILEEHESLFSRGIQDRVNNINDPLEKNMVKLRQCIQQLDEDEWQFTNNLDEDFSTF
ncbi:769_t:CDS:2 [Diversispora eburnea]|uniref:769_t:CDS:1 n=1 Tax=Diversispora eburnea TaxID=1213867 RepID=A0A9N8V268_9GLOM|nr:769_t:CDS:2 [Diversispora eburnea]